MTSTGPPFTGATAFASLRGSTSLSRQGPCLFDVGFPPSGPGSGFSPPVCCACQSHQLRIASQSCVERREPEAVFVAENDSFSLRILPLLSKRLWLPPLHGASRSDAELERGAGG
jgi:hypothetical protein